MKLDRLAVYVIIYGNKVQKLLALHVCRKDIGSISEVKLIEHRNSHGEASFDHQFLQTPADIVGTIIRV